MFFIRLSFSLVLVLLLHSPRTVIHSNTAANEQNNELYLTRKKESYNFLEESLNSLEGSKASTFETVKRRVYSVDLSIAHDKIIMDLKFSMLKNIINVKNNILNCISESILHMVRAIEPILEETLTYNKFCTSIEEQFFPLYEIDEIYKDKIEGCRESTHDTIFLNYFGIPINDVELTLNTYKFDPEIMFRHLNHIENCLNEFYLKMNRPFNEYVKETELYRNFMKTYKKGDTNIENVDYIKVFLDKFDSGWDTTKVLEFFDEMYDHYSLNSYYVPCFLIL
ncbi:hypothetical protein MKS88_002443 [Plasmodium brasilianum]|uniref:Uncharacterized protein n=2 Tax=Plasmodium (Plasmodium) TaxID=418103 RepID=A0A1A8WW34_PLAMA|nr:conserved Plasmodium protein, unknown function [Plasmodium malariae]KAI4838932.1 hypothetical protein MKS88_002443 [Plasmodium brasilianum]SBS96089.1 conserved Plasmodium protein, unknown function [Plasmodium malariae]SCN12277.1 conserved Plasmodium protein, unknown function [Plasmodium malariae]